MLDFSKIEAGMRVLDEQVLDLRRTVDEAVALIAKRAADKGLDLRIELPAAMPTVLRADHGRVRQVLLNRSEEHTSELQSLMRISYAVFCLKKKKKMSRSYEYLQINTQYTTSSLTIHTQHIKH